MKKLFVILATFLFCLCACNSSQTSSSTSTPTPLPQNESATSETIISSGDSENISNSSAIISDTDTNTQFANYDAHDSRASEYLWDGPNQKVLTLSEAQEIINTSGYLDTAWHDLSGNPFGGDNSTKEILFIVQTGGDETYENYAICYSFNGEIISDWIGRDISVNNNCWTFSNGYDGFLYVDENEVQNFENWAIESDNYEYYYSETLIDEIAYKIEASANRNSYDYKDLLRNPADYIGLTTCIQGTVTWIGDYNFIFTTSGGDIYIIYADESTPNILVEDSCTIFGEFSGTEEYYTTNIYGVTTSHTAVCLYAAFLTTGTYDDIPCDERELDLIYTTFARPGGGGDVTIDYTTIGYSKYDSRQEYIMTFGSKEVLNGTERIPLTIEYYISSEDINVYAEGYFYPWSRQIYWYSANSWLFYFDTATTYSESWASK